MMTEIDEQRVKRADELAHAGRFSEALEEYRALAQSIEDPYKAGMLLNEVMCLRELGEVDLAKRRLNQIKANVADVRKCPDSEGDDLEPCFAVELRFEEIGLYLAEGREKQALAKIEDLLARYPKHIRRPEHRSVYEIVQTRHAFLLANFGRCSEARPILEEACSFEHEKSSVYYYLGHCYCALGVSEANWAGLLLPLGSGSQEEFLIG